MEVKQNYEELLIRYTDIVILIDFLSTGNLPLVDPSKWGDKNDVFFLKKYLANLKSKKPHKKLFALCFTQQFERSHFWEVFSKNNFGVAIEFKKKLILELAENKGIKHANVKYKKINDLRSESETSEDLAENVTKNQLPFIKRWQFQDEKEYRLFYLKESNSEFKDEFLDFQVPIEAIHRIVFSPHLHKHHRRSLKEMIKRLPMVEKYEKEVGELKISKSRLYDNPHFQNAISDN